MKKMMRYYRGNFWRFANLMRNGELNQIIRPGKFYNRPVNNVEQILHFKDIHFEKLINKTLDEYVMNVIFISTESGSYNHWQDKPYVILLLSFSD